MKIKISDTTRGVLFLCLVFIVGVGSGILIGSDWNPEPVVEIQREEYVRKTGDLSFFVCHIAGTGTGETRITTPLFAYVVSAFYSFDNIADAAFLYEKLSGDPARTLLEVEAISQRVSRIKEDARKLRREL